MTTNATPAPALPRIVWGIERRHFSNHYEYIIFTGIEDETGIHPARWDMTENAYTLSPYFHRKDLAEKAMRARGYVKRGETILHVERPGNGPLVRY